MYCPKCGTAEQSIETYCRRCGIFLPDPFAVKKPSQTPADHVRANLVLNAMTVVVSFTLAILIYVMLAFRPDTHPLIYVTAGLLIAMGCWHTQTLWRSILLRRHFKSAQRPQELEKQASDRETNDLLGSSEFVPAAGWSVTERTTRDLEKTKVRSS